MIRTLHQHTIAANLDQLRPTQCTIGYEEVHGKVQQWQAMPHKKRKAMLRDHWFPTVLGPEGQPFIVDHHHLGMALHRVGESKVHLLLLKDLSHLNWDMFWRVMEFHQWVHPFDAKGKRVPYARIPEHVKHLQDDPFRSLAGQVRTRGGFAKDVTPFSEFLWAEHFRQSLSVQLLAKDFSQALALALKMASHQDASYLPGWVGDSSNSV